LQEENGIANGIQEKKCQLCEINIDEDFVKSFKPKDYKSLHGFCRSCREKLRTLQTKFGGKVCSRCCVDKPFGDFPHHKKTYDGFDSWCKQCRRDYRYEVNQTLDAHMRARLSSIMEDRRKIYTDLTLSQLIELWNKQDGKCAISGVPMTYQRIKRQHNMYNCSVDRIDSSKNYTIDNVQLVCWIVNRMKGENTTEELIKWCKYIIENNK
jgi:hypothetical protein